jgi:hypothetical protein
MSRRPAPYGGDGLRGYEIFTSYSRDIPERDELVAEKRAQVFACESPTFPAPACRVVFSHTAFRGGSPSAARDNAMSKYRVKFIPNDDPDGRGYIESYSTARRAKEVVELTHTRHRAAETHAIYLGRD